MNPTELLNAIAFAAYKHRDQRRKDAEASPFINHPIGVATVLATEAGISDEDATLQRTVPADRTFAAGQGDTERPLTEVHGSNNCSFTAAHRLVPSARNLPEQAF